MLFQGTGGTLGVPRLMQQHGLHAGMQARAQLGLGFKFDFVFTHPPVPRAAVLQVEVAAHLVAVFPIARQLHQCRAQQQLQGLDRAALIDAAVCRWGGRGQRGRYCGGGLPGALGGTEAWPP